MYWKDLLIRHKWLPPRFLIDEYGIRKHDIDNFMRGRRAFFDGWRLSLKSRDQYQLRRILADAAKFYWRRPNVLPESADTHEWVTALISHKNVRHTHFSFLTDSRYLKTAFPREFERYRTRGLTNTAFVAWHLYPGHELLESLGVLPWMFHQTTRAIRDFVPPTAMLEHIYLWFYCTDEDRSEPDFPRERFVIRGLEQRFLTSADLALFGMPQNLYRPDTLREIKESLQRRYSDELGLGSAGQAWSRGAFFRRHPEIQFSRCAFCASRVFDLHHLLPRAAYPEFAFHAENVIPLCPNIHGAWTRRLLPADLQRAYLIAMKQWLKTPSVLLFNDVMHQAHEYISPTLVSDQG